MQWVFCEIALTLIHSLSATVLSLPVCVFAWMPEEEAIAPLRSNWGVVMQPACSLCATKSLLRNSQGCRLFMGRWWWAKKARVVVLADQWKWLSWEARVIQSRQCAPAVLRWRGKSFTHSLLADDGVLTTSFPNTTKQRTQNFRCKFRQIEIRCCLLNLKFKFAECAVRITLGSNYQFACGRKRVCRSSRVLAHLSSNLSECGRTEVREGSTHT